MARAIVCLPSQSALVKLTIQLTLTNVKTKTFNSVDEGFEYLWNEGQHVGLFILDLDDQHIEELWTCAANWPDLHFIALRESDEKLPDPTNNITLHHHKMDTPQAISEMQGLVAPQISRIGGE